jgi:hypothetical protein
VRKTPLVSDHYPAAPPPPESAEPDGLPAPEPPQALRPVVTLLMVNLGLSVLLTVVVLLARHSVITYQLDHRHITDAAERSTLRKSYSVSLWGRVLGNIVVSIVYVYLVRALLRGRRWAYRRVILIGAVGTLGLLLTQLTPYPPWMRAEQLALGVVLGTLLYFVTRPEVRAYFDKGLPGRQTRHFRH